MQRLRQAQRRDAGLPFVDIIASAAPEGSVPAEATQAAAARTAAGEPEAHRLAVSGSLDEA